MYWEHGFDCFQFDDNLVVDEDVDAKTDIGEMYAFVYDGNGYLGLSIQPVFAQLEDKSRGICAFQ